MSIALPSALIPPYPYIESNWWRAARHVRPDLLVRAGQPVNWIVDHTMQGGIATLNPPDTTAEDAARLFASSGWTRQVSAHRVADTDSLIQCVPASGVAFTQVANDYTLTLETGGRSEWSRGQWEDHDGLLTSIAASNAFDCIATGIPPVWLPGEVLADADGMLAGIIDHHNINLFGTIKGQTFMRRYWRADQTAPATIDLSHTDCGTQFPYDIVVARSAQIVIDQTNPQPVLHGGKLVNTVIKIEGHYAIFAGDMDEQGVVHNVRHLGPNMNARIGLVDVGTPNERPVLPGSNVLTRTRASMNDFTYVGRDLPFSDGSGQPDWTTADFYAGA